MITNKSTRSKTTRSTQHKEDYNHEYTYRKTKTLDTGETGR